MTRLNSLLMLLLSLGALFFLSACGAGGSGGSSGAYKPWDFGRSTQAQEAPGKLSDLKKLPPIQVPPSAESIEGAEAVPPQKRELPVVKVGLLLPLSGEHKVLGDAMLKAAQMALFDVGHNTFELLPRDTGGTPDGAARAAQSVVDQGAQLVLGPVFSASVAAAKPVAGAAGVNMVAFSTDWSLAGDNTYIMGFLPFDQVERIVSYAAAKNVGRIGVIAPDSDYGRAVVSAYRSMASRARLSTADIQTYPAHGADLSMVLRQFSEYDNRMSRAEALGRARGQSDQPAAVDEINPPFDAVLMPVGGDEAVTVAGLLSEYQLHANQVKRLGTGLFDNPALASEQSLDGAWFAAPSPKLRRNFENRFHSTYGMAAPRLSSLAYDATALAAVLADRGLRSTGQPAFDQASIGNPNGFAGIDGIFRFRPNGTAERGLAVLEMRRGRIIVLDDAPRTFQAYRTF